MRRFRPESRKSVFVAFSKRCPCSVSGGGELSVYTKKFPHQVVMEAKDARTGVQTQGGPCQGVSVSDRGLDFAVCRWRRVQIMGMTNSACT